jgi:hypothetical protein
MTNIPIATKKRTSYENLVAECPLCREENTFNRASDLHTFEPIGGLNVTCQIDTCQKLFRIVGDSVNTAHEMLIFDCYELIGRKHYMSCILSLAQAYEVFFNLFFRVELLYKPFAADPDREISNLNRLAADLRKKMQKHTFAPMRKLFLSHLVASHSPKTLAEASRLAKALPDRPLNPDDEAIESLPNPKLVSLLKALKGTDIHMQRNEVVHKRAYRPTRDQVDAALKETRSILFPLTSRLELHDEVNWYMRGINSFP